MTNRFWFIVFCFLQHKKQHDRRKKHIQFKSIAYKSVLSFCVFAMSAVIVTTSSSSASVALCIYMIYISRYFWALFVYIVWREYLLKSHYWFCFTIRGFVLHRLSLIVDRVNENKKHKMEQITYHRLTHSKVDESAHTS